MLKLELTEEQKEQLKDYFEAVRRGNERGVCSAIAAQIWTDGIVVKVMHGKRAEALASALGGSLNSIHHSAADRLSSSPEWPNATDCF